LEPKPLPLNDLTPPDHLGEIARTKYIQLAETLSEIGVLKVTDLDVTLPPQIGPSRM
jgi:phage terminase small subunit